VARDDGSPPLGPPDPVPGARLDGVARAWLDDVARAQLGAPARPRLDVLLGAPARAALP
jgi:hypothetical protein